MREEFEALQKKSKEQGWDIPSNIAPQMGCVVCKAQIKKAENFARIETDFASSQQTVGMSFLELIKNLTPRDSGLSQKEREKAKGCQIFFPSTVFFVNDRIDFIAMNDKDYCLYLKHAGSNMLEIR